MTKEEVEEWKSQIVISNAEKMGLRKAPMVFTEHGVAMLSSVLNSDRAIFAYFKELKSVEKSKSDFENRNRVGYKI